MEHYHCMFLPNSCAVICAEHPVVANGYSKLPLPETAVVYVGLEQRASNGIWNLLGKKNRFHSSYWSQKDADSWVNLEIMLNTQPHSYFCCRTALPLWHLLFSISPIWQADNQGEPWTSKKQAKVRRRERKNTRSTKKMHLCFSHFPRDWIVSSSCDR